VTELELLRRRRELVVLSADVQRATVIHRLDRIEASPVRMLLGLAANATRVVAARRIALAVLALAGRLLGRRTNPERA
jgi:hypothetical protein